MSSVEEYLIEAESLDEKRHVQGTYVGVRYDNDTEVYVAHWCRVNGIQNPLDINDIHTTVIYSHAPLPDYCPLNTIRPPMRLDATDFRLDIFGPEHDTLVVKFRSKFLTGRFAYAMSLGALTDYPDYAPHITLGKNQPPYLSLASFSPFAPPNMMIREEYKEPLDPKNGRNDKIREVMNR